MSGDDAWLEPLKDKFTARLSGERKALLDLINQPDRENMIDRAHKLAGIAGMLGAPAIGEAALRLEEAARTNSGHDAELRALLKAIADYLS